MFQTNSWIHFKYYNSVFISEVFVDIVKVNFQNYQT